MKLRLTALGLAGLIIVLDRVSKLWIESSMKLWNSYNVIPGFFDIVHARNKGMAFGLFADSTSEFRTFLLVGVSGVVLVFIAILIWRLPTDAKHAPWASALALGSIFGGAIGNQYDRIARGSVTDFLDVYVGSHHWPAFNVADSAITIGAILMAITMLRSPDSKKQA